MIASLCHCLFRITTYIVKILNIYSLQLKEWGFLAKREQPIYPQHTTLPRSRATTHTITTKLITPSLGWVGGRTICLNGLLCCSPKIKWFFYGQEMMHFEDHLCFLLFNAQKEKKWVAF